MTEYVRLGDVANISAGGTPSRGKSEYWDNGTIPWVKIGDIHGKYVTDTEEKITVEGLKNSSAKIFPKGTILFSIFATLGDVGILEIEAATNQAIAGLQFDGCVDTNYAYYYLSSLKTVVERKGRGAAQQNINQKILKNLEIPLPPLEEQKRIAAALDKMSSVIAKRKRQIALLDEAAKSLFVEMFGDPVENPMGWEEVSLSKCLNSIENGKSFVCDSEKRKGTAPAVLKLSAATYGYYQPEENKAIISESQFIAKAEVHAGDLLFTRKNTPELVGMCAYVFSTPEKLMMPDLIFRLNTNSHCNKLFLWMLINHDLFREKIRCLASGSAKSMSNISKKSLNNLEIPLPPLDLQNLFAARIEALEAQRASCERGLKQMETAFAAMMQEYFE